MHCLPPWLWQMPIRHRATKESIATSHASLAKPFKSPMVPNGRQAISKDRAPTSTSSLSSSPITPLRNISSSKTYLATSGSNQSPLMSVKNSSQAGKAFKSPFAKSSSSSTAVSERKAIQDLEKKLMTLKQAQKYRLDGSTKNLQELASKWKTAAREAAQELWDLSQNGVGNGGAGDNSSCEGKANGWGYDDGGTGDKSWGYGGDDEVLSNLKGGKQSGMSGWGWVDESSGAERGENNDGAAPSNWEPTSPSTLATQLTRGSQEKAGEGRRYWEESSPSSRQSAYPRPVENREEKEKEPEQHNIGSMLTALGIPKDTLGWKDEEEDFVD